MKSKMGMRSSALSSARGNWQLFALSNAAQAGRAETILAPVRAAIALFCFVTVYFDRTEAARYGAQAYIPLMAYACLAIGLLIWTRWRSVQPETALILYAAEFLLVVLISVFTPGSSVPFLISSSFVILAAAYRWGLTETVLTGALFFGVFLAESFSTRAGYAEGMTRSAVSLIYLPLVAWLVAYLAGQQNRAKAEDFLITRILRVCQTEGAISPIVHSCLRTIADFYSAKGAVLIVQESKSHRVLQWLYPLLDGKASSRLEDLDAEKGSKYLFWSPVSIWSWQDLHSGSNCRAAGLDHNGRFVPRLRFQPPESFLEEVSCGSILAGALVCGDDFAARLYILDPQWTSPGSRELLSLSRLSEEVRRVAHNLYLWRKVRSRAHIIEQLRAARDMHDGIIQSLIALELEIEALLLKGQLDAASRMQLERVQKMLREQSQEVRDLMYQMKRPGITSGELIPFLENLVMKFGNETGIAARFESHIDEPSLPAKACHEVARIVQEALVNVRKHSRATHVEVIVNNDGRDFVLIIEDNGEGSELDSWQYSEKGSPRSWQPAVIRERVLLLKGSLRIERKPASGVRLLIKFPMSDYSEWYTPDSPIIHESRPVLGSSLSFRQAIKAFDKLLKQ
jgi:signal transduction histidine kinase